MASAVRDYPEEIDLHQYWLVLKRHWPAAVAVGLTSIGLAVATVSTQRDLVSAQGKLLFEADRTTELTGVSGNLGNLQPLDTKGNPLDTQALILTSWPILEETITALGLETDQGAAMSPKDLAEGLEVKPVLGTDVLEVNYKTTNQQLAIQVVNQLMESYIANNILANRSETTAAREYIAEQLPRAQKDVEQAAEALRLFKARQKIIAVEQESSAIAQALVTLDSQISDQAAQIADIDAQTQELRRQLGTEGDRPLDFSSLSQSPEVQQLQGELQQVQQQLVAEQTRYTSQHPIVVKLRNQEVALQKRLNQRLSALIGGSLPSNSDQLLVGGLRQELLGSLVRLGVQRLGLSRKLKTLEQQRQLYATRAQVLPTLEKRQQQLERKLATVQKAYEDLLSRFQEIRVAENQAVGNARVIQAAQILPQGAKSRKKLYLVAGGVAGLCMGIAVAFLLDLLDRSVKTVPEAEKVFGYPLIGELPAPKTPYRLWGTAERVVDPVPVMEGEQSLIKDAYQRLQANLKFMSREKLARTLVIASSTAVEGKSQVAANLAAAIAQSGQRVLLVDADLRNPSQHDIWCSWGLINAVGLSHVVSGQQNLTHAEQMITPHLSLLTAGICPANPLSVIDSEPMEALVQLLAQSYDYVIIDAPPLSEAADAAILTKFADGMLLVVKPGAVDLASAAAAKSLLIRAESQVLGLVANGATNNGFLPSSPFGVSSFDFTPSSLPPREKVLDPLESIETELSSNTWH